jgi:hypothetical protein
MFPAQPAKMRFGIYLVFMDRQLARCSTVLFNPSIFSFISFIAFVIRRAIFHEER